MKSLLLIALLWFAVASFASAKKGGDIVTRALSGDDNGNSGDYGQYDNGNTTFVTQVADRLDQDFAAMWTTPPNTWGDEYWEVFVTALVLVFLYLCCICSAICSPCCSNESSNGNRMDIITQEEVDAQRKQRSLVESQGKKLSQPILTDDQYQLQSSTPEEENAPAANNTSWFSSLGGTPNDDSKSSKNDKDLEASTDQNGTDQRAEEGKRSKSKVDWKLCVNEVVDVWSDFLTGTFDVAKNKRYHTSTSRSPRRSKQRRRKREDEYKSPDYEDTTHEYEEGLV